MKTMIRRIDDLGRIILPAEIRKELDITYQTPMSITVQDGGIFLKEYQPADDTPVLKTLAQLKTEIANDINITTRASILQSLDDICKEIKDNTRYD